MNGPDNFHDELTAHLAASEHPLPHPRDHGYRRREPQWRPVTQPVKKVEPRRKGEGVAWLIFAVGLALLATAWWKG